MVKYIVLAVYVLCVVGLVLLKRQGKIKSEYSKIIVAVLIPIVGLILLIVCEKMYIDNQCGIDSNKINGLKVKDSKEDTKNFGNELVGNDYIPLEEALLINDVSTRRRIMLDILKKNPGEYIDVLNKAKLCDDVEVVHYATSTMMGIQTEYDNKLRECKEKFLKNVSDKTNFRNYVKLLKKYIDEGFLQGEALKNRRIELDYVLNTEQSNMDEKRYVFLNVQNKIELKMFDGAKKLLDMAKEKWEEEEKVYMLLCNLYRDSNKGYMIKNVLDEVRDKGLYLSPEGRKWFDFWNGGRAWEGM